MEINKQTYNQLVLGGLAVATLTALLLLVGLFLLLLNRDRERAQYPGSILISSHSNYRGLPFEYRWDDAYRTTDNFTTVYTWYSIKYDLGAEVGAVEKCIILDGTNDLWAARRHISVSLCNVPGGQYIYVTRFTTFNGRSTVLGSVRELQSLFATN